MARQERPFGGINVLGLRTAERPQGVGAPTLPPPTRAASVPKTLEEAVIRDSRTAEQPKKPKNRLLTKVGLTGAGLLALAGGVLGINKIRGNDEPTPQAASQTRSADFPNTFNSQEGPQLVSSSPEKQPPNPKITNYDNRPIKAQKFKIPPPNRIPSEDTSPQYMPIDQLSTIKEHTAEYSLDGNYNNFQSGIEFLLEEQSESYISRRVTPKGLEPIKQEFTNHAAMGINGYIVGKEIHADRNVLLAIYAPGKNGLSNPDNIDQSILSVENITDDGKKGKISGAIVWIKAEYFEGYSLPFSFNSSWHESSTNKFDKSKQSNIPEELFRYIEIGDPVRASGGMLQVLPWAENLLDENYKERNNHLTYEEAREKYLNMVRGNTETIQRMLADAKTGGVSLKEQFETERYVVQVHNVRLVPRD